MQSAITVKFFCERKPWNLLSNLSVGRQYLESMVNLPFSHSTTNIQEVCRHSSMQLYQIHSRHRKSSTINCTSVTATAIINEANVKVPSRDMTACMCALTAFSTRAATNRRKLLLGWIRITGAIIRPIQIVNMMQCWFLHEQYLLVQIHRHHYHKWQCSLC